MKKDLHPKGYRFVVFKDMSNGVTFLSKSTAQSRETIKYEDGNEYPLIKLEISNTSHPFFTGKNMLVDTAGRIDKFKKRYEKKTKYFFLLTSHNLFPLRLEGIFFNRRVGGGKVGMF